MAHVGPPRESARPSPRAPPSRRGSISRCSLDYLAGSVLAWRPSGAQVIRANISCTRVYDGGSICHEADARLVISGRGIRQGSRAAKSPSTPSFRSAPSAVRCGWLVLMRKTVDYIGFRWRKLPLLFICFCFSSLTV